MNGFRRHARINVKALIILVLIIGVLGAGAIGGHFIRKRYIANKALTAAKEHLANKNWPEAVKELRQYLRQYNEDEAILAEYANANLAVRPRTAENILSAIDGYRRLLRRHLADADLSEKLGRLYLLIHDYENARYVCEKRLEKAPDDANATIMLARVRMARSRPEDARQILLPLVERDTPHSVEAFAMLARITTELDETPAGVDRAMEFLNSGIERNPESPSAYINRAAFHLDDVGRRKSVGPAKARADVETAARFKTEDPGQRLQLARAWVLVGGVEEAKSILADLENVDPSTSETWHEITDPDEFRLGWFVVNGALLRRTGDTAAMGVLADRANKELPDRYRTAFLPSAIELYLLAGRTADASQTLEDFRVQLDESTRGRAAGDPRLGILSARVALAENRPYDAIELLKPIHALNADNDDTWRLLADAYLRTNQNRAALELLRQQVSRRPDDYVAASQLVREFAKRGDWSAALQQARACEAQRPGDLDMKLVRIEAELRTGPTRGSAAQLAERIKTELGKLREQYPESGQVRSLQAFVAEREGRVDEAVRLLEGAIKDCGQSPDIVVQLAGLLNRNGRRDEAISLCRSAVGRNTASTSLWLSLSQLYLNAGQSDDAKKTLEEAIAKITKPEDITALKRSLARVLLMHSDRSAGVAMLKELATQNPDDVTTRLTLLETSDVLADAALTQRYIDEIKAIEGDAGLLWRLHQARLWLASGQFRSRATEIAQYLEYCVQNRPDWWSRASVLLGGLYERLDNFARSEEIYRQALEYDPTAEDVVDKLLKVLQRQGRFADAQDILNQFGGRSGPALEAHRLAVALGTGEYEKAIDDLEAKVAADPKAVEPRVLLARLLYGRRKEVDRAFKLLDEAAALGPDSLSPIGGRVYVLSSEKRLDEARALLDSETAKRADFPTFLLRAEFLADNGQNDLAEADFRRLTQFEGSQGAGFELLGRFFFSTGRPADAIAAWEQGLAVDPKRGSLKIRLMRGLLVGTDPADQQRGRTMLEDLLKEIPDNTDLLALHAKVLLEAGTPEATEKARGELEHIIQIDPKAVVAYLALIDLAIGRGDFESAGALATVGLQGSPRDPRLLMAAAESERAKGNSTLARDFARTALAANPKNVGAYLLLIDDAVLSGDMNAAKQLLKSVIAVAPDDPKVRLKQAAVLGAAGESEEAISILEDLAALKSGVDPMSVTMMLADLYCDAGNNDRFEAKVADAERLFPGAPTAVRMRLRCLAKRKEFDAIAQLLAGHYAKHPDDAVTLLAGASVLVGAGPERLKQARSLYDQVVAADPKNVEGHLGVAKAAFAAGDMEAVVRGYRGALAVNPDHQQALNDLAWVLSGDEKTIEEALALATRGVDRYPADPHLRDTRGVIFTKLNRLNEAVEDLTRAIDFAASALATRAEAMIHLAEVYIKQDDKMAARIQLNEVKSLDLKQKVLNDANRAKVAQLLGSL